MGGLAAAMADGLSAVMSPPARVIVVEPKDAACVTAALEAGRPVAVGGTLETAAEMLSCGEASAPALRLLRRFGAEALAVSETTLVAAPACLAAHGGPATTPSGAAGLAGLCRAIRDDSMRVRLGLRPTSRVLLVVTEASIR